MIPRQLPRLAHLSILDTEFEKIGGTRPFFSAASLPSLRFFAWRETYDHPPFDLELAIKVFAPQLEAIIIDANKILFNLSSDLLALIANKTLFDHDTNTFVGMYTFEFGERIPTLPHLRVWDLDGSPIPLFSTAGLDMALPGVESLCLPTRARDDDGAAAASLLPSPRLPSRPHRSLPRLALQVVSSGWPVFAAGASGRAEFAALEERRLVQLGQKGKWNSGDVRERLVESTRATGDRGCSGGLGTEAFYETRWKLLLWRR